MIAKTLRCWGATLVLGGALTGCAGTGGQTGPTAAASTSELAGRRADVVVAALSQVGTPYVYGGSTPGKALDCSALTRFAHRAAGLEIPRVSTAQQAAAEPRQGRPHPGDLVFFKTGPGQYHVGIMVDGRRFVHASTSKRRVRLANLDGDYWQNRYIGAGTYLN